MGGGYIHRAFYRLSRPVCRFFGGCSLAERLLFFAGSPELPQQPVHHWHLTICNRHAVLVSL
jgi:hypothetical protein